MEAEARVAAEDRAREGDRGGRDGAETRIGPISLNRSRRPPRNRETWPRADRPEGKNALVVPAEAARTVPARAASDRMVKGEEAGLSGVDREGGRSLRPVQKRTPEQSNLPGVIPGAGGDPSLRTDGFSRVARRRARNHPQKTAWKINCGVSVRSRPMANPTSPIPMGPGLISRQ